MMAGMRRYKRMLAICSAAAVLLSSAALTPLPAYANEQSVERVGTEANAAAAEADSGQTGPYQGEGQSAPDVQNAAASSPEEYAVGGNENSDEDSAAADATGTGSPDTNTDTSDSSAGTVEGSPTGDAGELGVTSEEETGSDGTTEEAASGEEAGESSSEDAPGGEPGEADAETEEPETEESEGSPEDEDDDENQDELPGEDETLEENAPDAEDALTALEEEGDDGDPVRYDVQIDGITVYAEVPHDAFSEEVTLVVSMIESERDLEEVADTLDASNVTYDDYLALDIHWENADGDEVEPDGEIRVTFDLAENVLPESVDTDTLSVQHFDTSSGDVEVVTVADTTSDSSTGDVTVSGGAEMLADGGDVTAVAEFAVASFSTFTITWNYSNGWWDSQTQDLSVLCMDEANNELPATVAPNAVSITSGREVDLTSSNSDLAIDGYELTGVSAYVNNTSYENVTSIKATYSSRGWSGGSWTYTLYSGTSQVYSGSTKPSLTLIYGTGEIRISYTLDASDADGSAPMAQTAELNGYITLPECTATREGYTFLGWTEKEFKIAGSVSDLQTIYQPGDRYKVTGSQTLHAAWSKDGLTRSDFYVRLDGTIPSIDADRNSDYSKGIRIDNNVRHQKWIYDTDGTLCETTERDYKQNSITDNLETLPTNQQIVDDVNNSGITLKLALNDNGKIVVTQAGSGFAVGEELYMHWYAQKYQYTANNLWTWHIDGSLLAKDKVTINYVDNAASKGLVSGMPTGYQVTKGTTVKAGSSVSATGEIKSPSLKNYEFLGWNTKADNTGTFYASGEEITLNENTTLYAIWKDPTAGIVDTGIQLGTAAHAAMICVAMGAVVMAGLCAFVRRRLRVL